MIKQQVITENANLILCVLVTKPSLLLLNILFPLSNPKTLFWNENKGMDLSAFAILKE